MTAPPFSRRLRWDVGEEAENALARALAKRRAAGEGVLDLTESNPTRAGLSGDDPRVLELLAAPEALLYEPQPLGLPVARRAVAGFLRETRGVDLPPERIWMTASTSEAYALLFKLLCDPGDVVLIPEPSYPLFGYLSALEGVETVGYPLRYDGEWHVDVPALGELLRAHPRARAVLVVSPGNPTGAFLKLDERAAIAALCAGSGCALVSDEVFADSGAPPGPRASPRMACAAAHDDVLSFSLSGLSKVCGLPQLKLGWCAVGGPADQVAAALARLELIADTYLSVATPVQCAAPALLALREPFQERVAARTRANRRRLCDALPAGAACSVLPSEGGWSAVLAVPRWRSEEEWALALLDAGVLVHPGYFFDFPAHGAAHLVVSLLPLPEVFDEAARRLALVLCSQPERDPPS